MIDLTSRLIRQVPGDLNVVPSSIVLGLFVSALVLLVRVGFGDGGCATGPDGVLFDGPYDGLDPLEELVTSPVLCKECHRPN